MLPVERVVVIASPKPKTCFPLTLPSKSWVWGLTVVGTLGVLGLVVGVCFVVTGGAEDAELLPLPHPPVRGQGNAAYAALPPVAQLMRIEPLSCVAH